MAKTDKEFLISVRADIRQAVAQLNGLGRELGQTVQQAPKANAGLSNMAGSIGRLKAAAAGYLSIQFARSLLTDADAYHVLQDRIRTATAASGDYAEVSRGLGQIASRTGTALETTVSVFQGLARTGPELGATNQQMLNLTRAVQQLGVISGASQASMNAGLLQFSQGLAAGVFRAEEFNSLLENLPEVANRIAGGMSMTVGQLRQAVLSGSLLSKDVFQSLIGQTGAINAEFSKLPPRISRTRVSLGQAWDKYITRGDDALGITNAIARAQTKLTHWLDPESRTELEKMQAVLAHWNTLIDRTPQGSEALVVMETKRQEVLAAIDLLREIERRPTPHAGGVAAAQTPQDKEAEQKRLEQIKKLREELDEQAATLGKNQQQLALYRLQSLGATEADLNRAKVAADSITTYEAAEKAEQKRQQLREQAVGVLQSLRSEEEREADAERELYGLYQAQALSAEELAEARAGLAAHSKKARDAAEQLADAERRAAQIVEENRTPQEAHKQQLQEIFDLYESGALSVEQYRIALRRIQTVYAEQQEQLDEYSEGLKSVTRDAAQSFADAWADAAMTGKDTFSDFVSHVTRELLRLLIYQNAVKPLFSAFGAPGYAATQNHSGGLAGAGASRSVPAAAFAAAPRYHSGGIAGLKPNEVPTVLERGEEVLTRNDPRHRYNMGGAGAASPVVVRLENTGAAKEAVQAGASFDGEKMVVNVVLRDLERNGPLARGINSMVRGPSR